MLLIKTNLKFCISQRSSFIASKIQNYVLYYFVFEHSIIHCVTNFQYIFVYQKIRLSLYTTLAADSKYHIIYSIPSTFSAKRRSIEFCDCLLVFIYQ